MSAPGTLTFIGEIKTALVNDHHEAFYWWWKSKLQNVTLFHVDAHDDMRTANVDFKLKAAEDYTQLKIANFICPAVHHKIISSIYWLNPHAEERRLQYFRKPASHFSEREVILREQNYNYGWGPDQDEERIRDSVWENILMTKVSVPSDLPLILDIDLDAFCCHRNQTFGKEQQYDGVLDFEQRIDETIKTLSSLPKPDLITIASSQGDGKNRCYVPTFMVDDVARYLAINLRKLYE